MDEALRTMRSILTTAAVALLLAGCTSPERPYGAETTLRLPAGSRSVWAVAPAINLSGQRQVDPLLQADLLYQQLQQVEGLTVIPVNRVVEVYAAMGIEKVQSELQAMRVCEQLGCDALAVPTVTLYDPYDPPKVGASLQVFVKPAVGPQDDQVDPRALAHSAAPPSPNLPARPQFLQAVGMYDAANGSVRAALLNYAAGRSDPKGPLAEKEYLVSIDRYCGFVYHELILDLLYGTRSLPVAP